MTLPSANKLVAEALRELIEAKRARAAFHELHGFRVDPDENDELRALFEREYAADKRIEELASALYPPTVPRSRRRANP